MDEGVDGGERVGSDGGGREEGLGIGSGVSSGGGR